MTRQIANNKDGLWQQKKKKKKIPGAPKLICESKCLRVSDNHKLIIRQQHNWNIKNKNVNARE